MIYLYYASDSPIVEYKDPIELRIVIHCNPSSLVYGILAQVVDQSPQYGPTISISGLARSTTPMPPLQKPFLTHFRSVFEGVSFHKLDGEHVGKLKADILRI
jgi:hypothetical protein